MSDLTRNAQSQLPAIRHGRIPWPDQPVMRLLEEVIDSAASNRAEVRRAAIERRKNRVWRWLGRQVDGLANSQAAGVVALAVVAVTATVLTIALAPTPSEPSLWGLVCVVVLTPPAAVLIYRAPAASITIRMVRAMNQWMPLFTLPVLAVIQFAAVFSGFIYFVHDYAIALAASGWLAMGLMSMALMPTVVTTDPTPFGRFLIHLPDISSVLSAALLVAAVGRRPDGASVAGIMATALVALAGYVFRRRRRVSTRIVECAEALANAIQACRGAVGLDPEVARAGAALCRAFASPEGALLGGTRYSDLGVQRAIELLVAPAAWQGRLVGPGPWDLGNGLDPELVRRIRTMTESGRRRMLLMLCQGIRREFRFSIDVG